ncbi:MAG: methyltransferase domain-containing protein [Eubacteriales bacterium]|nr:methyltransferase domain-containing protein [Eubacteriales bacterium]
MERIDRTGFGSIRILQDPDSFCYGADAVILAGFTADHLLNRKKQPENLLDLGTGTGILPLILSHKTDIPEILGIEMQENSFRLAERNVGLNALEGRVRFLKGDIAELQNPVFSDLRDHFDLAVSNPPYVEKSKGISCGESAHHTARHETTAGLREFLKFTFYALKDKGELFVVNRPARTADLCILGREIRMEVKEIRFVSGHIEEAPNLVLARLVKNGRPGLRVLAPMHIREADGSMSEEMLRYHERNFEGGPYDYH